MESFTLEQASYLAEIIGLIAVVSSLVYLAIQVKQSALATQSETSNVVASNAMSQYLIFATNPEMFTIVQKGGHDPDSLTNEEQGRFYSMVFTVFINWQNFYYHWQKNQLETEGWAPWESLMSDSFSMTGIRNVWKSRRQYFQKDFREFVDELMSRPPNPDYKFLGVGQSN